MWTARRPPVANKLWATGGHRAAVYSRPFRWHQNTVLERFCIVSSGRHVGLRAWMALVDSLQLPKQMFRSCRRRWNCEKTASDGTGGTHNSTICRHWRCLGRVDVTCDKFDNRWYVLKTGYQFETGKPAYRLPFYKPSDNTVLFTIVALSSFNFFFRPAHTHIEQHVLSTTYSASTKA